MSNDFPKQKQYALKIGEYYISQMKNGDYWIEHESGEGMGVNKEKFEKMISDWYLANF